jgi:tripartite-type tricarboxylate transporter receptor subunit TctC
MTPRRRKFSIVLHVPLAVAGLAFTAASAAHGQTLSYPTRPVRLVVPFQPGGVVDIMGRLIAQRLSDNLGHNFYVDNRGGGGGNTGAAAAQAAPPDGYTILFTSSTFLVNPGFQKVPYEPVKGFAAITIASASPSILAVNPTVPAKTVSELVASIRQSPDKYSFASTGFGSTPHLQGEMFKLAYKLDLVHVPFGGGGPALQSTVSGHTPLTFAALPPAIPMVKDGLLRALAVVGPERVGALPDVPTMAEVGLPGFDAETILLALAPAGTPRPIVDLLYNEIGKVLREPEILQKFAVLGFSAVGSTPQQTTQRIEKELAMWAKVVRDANLQQQ